MCKPCSVRSPVEVPKWSVDWGTFRSVPPGVWSWIRQHRRQYCEHTASCIAPSSSCSWRWPSVTEKWHIGPLRSRTWPAWISSCHKSPGSSLILHWPAECWPTHSSAGNPAPLLEWFSSNTSWCLNVRSLRLFGVVWIMRRCWTPLPWYCHSNWRHRRGQCRAGTDRHWQVYVFILPRRCIDLWASSVTVCWDQRN